MPRSRTKDGAASRHRWVVDRIGEQTASVEHDADHVYDIPRALVPEGTREGDVLDVEIERTDEALTIRVSADPAETKRAKAQSARQLKAAKGKGGRGDVAL